LDAEDMIDSFWKQIDKDYGNGNGNGND